MVRFVCFLALIVALSNSSWPMVSENRPMIKAVIVYDNNRYDDRLRVDWGFSCYLEGLKKSILFDTGANGEILISNLKKIGVPPEKIGVVVLSHFHGDHTGGLEELLRHNPAIEVWVPDFFPETFKKKIKETGAKLIEVTKSRAICPGAFTSGVIEGNIGEQSLVLDTDEGLVVITGCAHPGIIKILNEVKNTFQKNIYLVFGGFHLGQTNEVEIKSIISQFRRLGVKKVGPAHCSGDLARKLFSENFAGDFLMLGVGREIIIGHGLEK